MAFRAEWRGRRDTRLRLVLGALGISLLLHVPLTPLSAPLGLVSLMKFEDDSDIEEPPEWIGIPVTLEDEPAPEPPKAGERPAAVEDEDEDLEDDDALDDDSDDDDDEAWSLPKKKLGTSKPDAGQAEQPLKAPGDAGADAAVGVNDAGADAGAPTATDAGADAAPVKPEPKPEPKPELPKSQPPVAERSKTIKDPVALSGSAGQLADANANIRLLVFGDRIRKHSTGALIGDLLGAAEQWAAFFKTAKLDPIKDIDRILIAGPQLRDSSHAVIVLKHHTSEEKIHGAIDRLVKQSKDKGAWLDDRIAKAHVDRADRVLVQQGRGVVIVGPVGIEAQAKQLKGPLSFPNPEGKEVVSVFLRTPYRAFKGIPFDMPESIRWVRMKLVPAGDGVTALLEAQDESPAAAQKHAAAFDSALNAVVTIKLSGLAARLLGKSEKRLVERVEFSAQGDRIVGKVSATGRQLAPLLEAISEYSKQLQEEAKKRAKERAEQKKKEDAEKAEKAKAAEEAKAGSKKPGFKEKAAAAASGSGKAAPSAPPPQPSGKPEE
ncbi:MAG: hypothetical protein AB7K71_29220 [Polyangiaceae bacterium]